MCLSSSVNLKFSSLSFLFFFKLNFICPLDSQHIPREQLAYTGKCVCVCVFDFNVDLSDV